MERRFDIWSSLWPYRRGMCAPFCKESSDEDFEVVLLSDLDKSNMALTYKKNNPKGTRRLAIGFFIIFLLIVLVFAIILGFIGTDHMMHRMLNDPDVVLHVTVSGGDVIVTIYEGRRVNDLSMLILEIEGVPIPSSMSMMPAPENGEGMVCFSNICTGITGVRKVGIRGVFTDGSSSLLKMSTIKFT